MEKALLKDTLLYGSADFFFKFINFALFPLYAFILPISDFGNLALMTTLTQLLCIIMNCGQTYALQRYHAEYKENATTTGFICISFLGLGITLVALFISYWQTALSFPYLFLMLGIVAAWPYQIFQYQLTTLRVNFRSWQFVSLNLFQNSFSIALCLILTLYFKLGLLGFLSSIAIANISAAVYCIMNCDRGQFDRQLAKQMILFGLPFIFTDLTNWLYASLDRWMLGEMANSVEVGYYSIAFKIATLMIFFINAFSLAWNPYIMKLYHENPNYKEVISQSLTKWIYFLVCLASMLILFNREILILTTPEAYWPASKLIPFISIGLAFHGTLVLSTTGLFLKKKTHYLTIGTWLCALFNFLLNFKLIPLLGAYGSSIACMCTYMLQASYYLICSQKIHPVSLEYKKICYSLLLLFGVFVLSQFANPLAKIAIFIAVLLIVLWIVKPTLLGKLRYAKQ